MMRWSLPVACLITLAACASAPQAPAPAAAVAPLPSAASIAAVRPSGLFLGNFDRSVRPQDDLYRFVNGTWLKQTEIPADKAAYAAFTVLADGAEKNLRAIAEEAAAAKAAAGTDQQRIGDFYASFMNEAQADKLGLAPLEPELARIDAIKDRRQLLDYLARAQVLKTNNPIALSIDPDARRPDVQTVWADQAGLGMPDRDYYLLDDARSREIRAAYQAHIAKVFTMAGREDAAGVAKRLMAFETRLARASWTRVDLRDVDKVYNPFDVAGASKATPGLDWSRWLGSMGITAHDQIIVGQPSYFKELGKTLNDAPLDTWRDYLRLRTIDSLSPYLSAEFVNENFAFYGHTLSGTPQLKARWKRALGVLEGSVGDLLGKEYVRRHFPPEAKRRMDELVSNLLKAFDGGITDLDWMGPETRQAAHDKIRNFTVKVGYPATWQEYPGLVVKNDDLVGNVLRVREVNAKRELAKLGKPVDRTEWRLTPQTVNAYYNPLANEIVFPAAILQPPFFDMNADDAVNYGGIGAVIGHEISHGFDNIGRKFDDTGMLRDWWTDADNKRFEARAGTLVKQYSAFSPLPGMNVNGQLTIGENIGDLSGLAVAHRAYQIALGGLPAPEIDGFTGDQRLYLGWGQVWADKVREDELRKRLLTDPHSPSEYRCNGVVRNMAAFQTAFDVKPGDGLYLPADQMARIW